MSRLRIKAFLRQQGKASTDAFLAGYGGEVVMFLPEGGGRTLPMNRRYSTLTARGEVRDAESARLKRASIRLSARDIFWDETRDWRREIARPEALREVDEHVLDEGLRRLVRNLCVRFGKGSGGGFAPCNKVVSARTEKAFQRLESRRRKKFNLINDVLFGRKDPPESMQLTRRSVNLSTGVVTQTTVTKAMPRPVTVRIKGGKYRGKYGEVVGSDPGSRGGATGRFLVVIPGTTDRATGVAQLGRRARHIYGSDRLVRGSGYPEDHPVLGRARWVSAKDVSPVSQRRFERFERNVRAGSRRPGVEVGVGVRGV